MADPLHGVTLDVILKTLVERYGFAELASRIDIRCFSVDPSIQSSLKFLRRTPWARKKVEALFLEGQDRSDAPKAPTVTSKRWDD